MKTPFSSIFLIILFCACGRGKYYVSNAFRKPVPANMETLNLDSTYHFYLRQVYKDKNELNENILKTNVEKKDTSNKTRIEVEYLLLSWVHKNAIYISTIPDKYQNYYSSNFFADTLINAYDFSTFYFGKISDDGESIFFISNNGKKVITWDIRPFINHGPPKQLSIREIAIQRNDLIENVILINKALEEPLSFILQNSFTIIFEVPGRRADTCKNLSAFCRLSDQKIYFDHMKRGIDLFFRFDRTISDSNDSSIRFDYRRSRYSPVEGQH